MMSNVSQDMNSQYETDDLADQEKAENRRIDDARKALIKNWQARATSANEFWDKRMFRQMRVDRLFAKGYQWQEPHILLKDGPIPADARRVINITQRHIKQQTATLYGKDPKIVCRHKERMVLSVWDGTQAALQSAMGTLQEVMMRQQDPALVMVPEAMELLASQQAQAQSVLQEAGEYVTYKQRARGIAKTLEIVIDHCLNEQPAPFKQKMKDMVRRALTTGLSYVKLTFNRATEPAPETMKELERVQAQLKAIERLTKDIADGDISPDSDAGAEELQQRLAQLQAEQEVLVYEGILLEYPDPTMLLVDPRVTNLRTFEGAAWIAEKMFLTRAQIRDRYSIDVGQTAKAYDIKDIYGGSSEHAEGNEFAQAVASAHTTGEQNQGQNSGEDNTSTASKDGDFHCVYEVYDKETGVTFTICEGVDDYLRPPAPPNFAQERFFPYHTLVFNEPDGPGDVVPQSDVSLIRPSQEDINSATESLLEHRLANRPGWVARKGVVDDQSKTNLATRKAHELIEINGQDGDQPIDKLIQRAPVSPIDPNMYETNSSFQNVLRVVGSQEAEIGGLSGATATEAAIAQGAKSTASGSDVDVLDEFLTSLVKAAGQLVQRNLSAETVSKIVGPSAVWPDLTREEVLREFFLEIEAGSTGKPNQAEETQRIQALAPLLFQVPGISPEWIANELVRRIDPRIDLSEAIAAGMPSLQAMNAMAVGAQRQAGSQPASGPGQAPQPSSQTGAPNAPEAQGPQGQNNLPNPAPPQVNAAARPGAGDANMGGFAL